MHSAEHRRLHICLSVVCISGYFLTWVFDVWRELDRKTADVLTVILTVLMGTPVFLSLTSTRSQSSLHKRDGDECNRCIAVSRYEDCLERAASRRNHCPE